MGMSIAYADPPYIGCADKYPEKQEVDHKALIEHLWHDFDCWVLSCSSPSLREILPLCPKTARIAAWVKPFASFKPNVNPAYAWEPVIFDGARWRPREVPTVRDWVSANITLQKGVAGAKPPAFCFWLFDLVGADPTDAFYDLFPGTGVVTEMWELWCNQRNWLIQPLAAKED